MEVTAKALRSRIGAICIDNRLSRPDPRATADGGGISLHGVKEACPE